MLPRQAFFCLTITGKTKTNTNCFVCIKVTDQYYIGHNLSHKIHDERVPARSHVCEPAHMFTFFFSSSVGFCPLTFFYPSFCCVNSKQLFHIECIFHMVAFVYNKTGVKSFMCCVFLYCESKSKSKKQERKFSHHQSTVTELEQRNNIAHQNIY